MDIQSILIWNYLGNGWKEFDLSTQDVAKEDNLAAWWREDGDFWISEGKLTEDPKAFTASTIVLQQKSHYNFYTKHDSLRQQ